MEIPGITEARWPNQPLKKAISGRRHHDSGDEA